MIGKIKITSSPMTTEAYREICNERRGDGRCAYIMEPEGCTTCSSSPLTVHELKTVQPWFDLVKSGAKPFEIRKDDRGFKVGDALILREWNPETEDYTGEFVLRFVTSKVDGGQYGVEVGTCVLGLVAPIYPVSASALSEVLEVMP